MGDRVVGLCNFCEVHGPRVVFVCQETSGLNGRKRIGDRQFYGDACSDLLGANSLIGDDSSSAAAANSETCDGCRSLINSKPAFLTNDHAKRLSYIGCQYPYRVDVFSRVRCACVRSLSCEACPGRQGPIVFGDAANGYCLSYVFTLKDSKARGFQHSYSIVVVSRQVDELIKNYSPLVDSLKSIVARLQSWSDRIFDREGVESSDRMPQIAASGRAGWMPSGFFLRSVGGGGTCRVVAAPRSLKELTNRFDVFARLHESFVDIHRLVATNETFGLREIDCSPCSGQNGDSLLSIDGEDGDAVYDDPNRCRVCAACTNGISSSAASAFKTLTLLYDILGSEAFSILIYHLLIGNQIVVRSSCVCSNRILLDALKLLLPAGCIKCVDSSREYRESWEYNLVGLLVDGSQNGADNHSSANNARKLPHPNSNLAGGDGCVILCVEAPTSTTTSEYGKNGKSDYLTASTAKDRPRNVTWESYHFRMFCTAAAASNNYFDYQDSPTLVQCLLNLLSTTFSKFYSTDEGAAAGSRILDCLKDEWLKKAKLYYVMSKKCGGEADDSWRTTFFRISKCNRMDESILRFWRGGLNRRFKQNVLTQCASQHQTSPICDVVSETKSGRRVVQNGNIVHEG